MANGSKGGALPTLALAPARASPYERRRRRYPVEIVEDRGEGSWGVRWPDGTEGSVWHEDLRRAEEAPPL